MKTALICAAPRGSLSHQVMTMRFSALVLVFLPFVASPVVAAPSQDSASLLRETVTFELRESTTDDELIAVARAADVNLIADATSFPKTAQVTPSRWPGSTKWAVSLLMEDIAAGRNLAWNLSGNNTLRVAARPDVASLRSKIAGGETVRLAHRALDDKAFGAALVAYLRDTQKWDATIDFVKDIPLSGLPQSLRREFVAMAQNQVLNNPIFGFAARKEELADAPWQAARFGIVADARRGELLTLGTTLNGTTMAHILGPLRPAK